MKVGLQIPDFTTPDGPGRLGADLATVARTADDAGFEYLAVMDHFFQIRAIGPPEQEMLEAYTTLGYLAAHTSRARLLTLVTGVIYRHPGMLVKMVTTLDVLSGGRAWLGIGAAWNEEESARPGRAVPADRRAVRAAGGDAADLPADVARRREPLPREALPAGPAAQLAAAADQAAPADPDRRLWRAEDAAAGGPVRPGLQPVPRPGRWRTSWTCCASTARRSAATTTRSRRPCYSCTTSARRARRRPRSWTSWARWPRWASSAAIGAVRQVWDVTPLEVIGSKVIPAVASL